MNNDINEIRKEIDKIDESIVSLLGERQDLVKKIGKIKKSLNLASENKAREKKILDRLKQRARKLNLDETFIGKVYEIILNNSKKVQNEK